MAALMVKVEYVNWCPTCRRVRRAGEREGREIPVCESASGEHDWQGSARWSSFLIVEAIARKGWDASGFAPTWAAV